MPKSEGHKNLIPFDQRTEEEQRAIRVAGGIASGKARRRKKTMREAVELIAKQQVTNQKLIKAATANMSELNPDDIDMITAATIGIFNAAIKGNVSAGEFIANMLEQAQVQEEMPEDELSKSLRELGEGI